MILHLSVHCFCFQREKGVGGGASLIFPDELLDAVRAMYPDGIKNYLPKAGKVLQYYFRCFVL